VGSDQQPGGTQLVQVLHELVPVDDLHHLTGSTPAIRRAFPVLRGATPQVLSTPPRPDRKLADAKVRSAVYHSFDKRETFSHAPDAQFVTK
jgi:hypothetical protein